MNLQIQSPQRPTRRQPGTALPAKGKIVTKAFNTPVILHTLCEDGAMSAQYDGDVRRQRERSIARAGSTRSEEISVAEPSIYWG